VNDAELRSLERLCSKDDLSDSNVATLTQLGLKAAQAIRRTLDMQARLAQVEAERDEARDHLRVSDELRAAQDDTVELNTAEQIAAWLDEWTPTLGECREALSEVVSEPVTLFASRPDTDTASMSDISFDNTVLVVMHAIRAGLWRKDHP